MKKLLSIVCVLTLTFMLIGCGKATEAPASSEAEVSTEVAETEEATVEATVEESAEVEAEEFVSMSYADFIAAEVDAPVAVTTYVQANQSWYNGKICLYTQNSEGGFYIYNAVCDEETAALLVPGTKINVTGFKGEWSGEVEFAEGATFEIVDDGDTFIAEAEDVTALLGTDALIEKQNSKVLFTDMTVSKVAYKNDQPGDDIYLTLSKDGADYEFCLEFYLNGSDEEFYNLVGGLEAGQTVDVEGFLYWYNGADTHITSVTVK